MSEFKFDKLKKYEAPNEWAERVIKTANEKKNVPIYRTRCFRATVVCACMILLCILSFTFCLQVLDETILPSVNVNETLGDSTKNHPATLYTDDETQEESQHESISDLTEKEEETQISTDATENVKPTKKKPEKETVKVENIKPTKKPQSQKETQASQSKPESTTVYVEPTETPIEYRVVCSNIIDKSLISENDAVYCRIYDCDDDIYLGDDDIFSSQHIAEIYGSSDSGCYVRYFPVKSGVITKNGEYIVMFYDANGRNLKTFGFTVKDF